MMEIENYTKKMIVYHGTNSTFEEFDYNKRGDNTGYNNTIHGIFFTDKYENAKLFGERIIQAEITINKTLDLRIQGIFNLEKQASVIMEIVSGEKMDSKQALEIINEEIGLGEIADFYDEINSEKSLKILKAEGYDSIISNLGSGNDEYIVFNLQQIKQLDKNFKKLETVTLNFSKLKENRIKL